MSNVCRTAGLYLKDGRVVFLTFKWPEKPETPIEDVIDAIFASKIVNVRVDELQSPSPFTTTARSGGVVGIRTSEILAIRIDGW